jgi:xylulokinase
VARRDGRPARIEEFTADIVAPDEATRCVPDLAAVARYRELQALQDKLSLTLREVFAVQRALAQK